MYSSPDMNFHHVFMFDEKIAVQNGLKLWRYYFVLVEIVQHAKCGHS